MFSQSGVMACEAVRRRGIRRGRSLVVSHGALPTAALSRAGLLRDSGVENGLVGGKDRYDFEEEYMASIDRVDGMPKLLDITSLAEHLGVNARHVRRLVAERRIPFIKWGHLIRFDPVEIREWIDAYRRHPGRPA